MTQEGKIFVVDDSPLFRVRMTNFLRNNYSFQIEEISSGRELKDYLHATPVEDILLIILDLFLPDGSGLAVIRQYKQETGIRNLPFIIVSARIDKDSVTAAFKEGAKHVIAKPLNFEQLKERIDNIISPEFIKVEKKTVMDYYRAIEMEAKRAKRGKYDLSILLAGIFFQVDFKAVYKDSSYSRMFNLEWKYPEALQKNMRETDAIISLSPSEYLFVLPFTDKKGSAVVREKVTGVFNNLVAEAERKNVLMVIGSATYPQDGASTEELIAYMEKDFKTQFTRREEQAVQHTGEVSGEMSKSEGQADRSEDTIQMKSKGNISD